MSMMSRRLQHAASLAVMAAFLAACQTAHHAPVPKTTAVTPVAPAGAHEAQSASPPPPAAPAPAEPDTRPMSIRLPPAVVATPHLRLADGRDIPAVQGLLARAAGFEARGAWEDASQLLERAQRLAPQSATVYQRLAGVRLHQNRTAEAEQLARKGLAFAVGNMQQAALWRLLASAAERQGKLDVSLQAKARAEQLEAQGDRS